MTSPPLKLSAADAEDVAVLSAFLQDSVIPITEMAYLPAEQRFAFVANRFRWEAVDGPPVAGVIYERVRCGVNFDLVEVVRRRNVDQRNRSEVLELLAVEAGEGYVDLVFAGGGTIRMEMARIVCHAEDFGDPWPTQWRPDHQIEEGETSGE